MIDLAPATKAIFASNGAITELPGLERAARIAADRNHLRVGVQAEISTPNQF
jgi:hypothetical protein